MTQSTETIRVSGLKVGDTLDRDIVGPGRVLLLAGGKRIEHALLALLRQRGIEEVTLGAGDEAAATAGAPERPAGSTPRACEADLPEIELTVAAGVALPPDAYEARPGAVPLPRLREAEFDRAAELASESMSSSVAAYEQLAGVFRAGRLGHGAAAVDLLLGLRRAADRDIDLMTLMVALDRATIAPAMQHAVRHAVVAMRLARSLAYGPDAVLDAGLVGLFSDIGMSETAEELIARPGRLSPTEWERVHRHCAASADVVEKIRGIRSIIAHAVYQHHERPDGSGYPRGRSGQFLHPLARIAAVADVFTAVMEPRPHRPARTPHHAVRAALEGVKAGRLDGQVVRALLAEVSLFPVGTPVTLSNGRGGWVHRTDEEATDRPIVAFRDGQKPAKVQLSLTPDLRITAVGEVSAPGLASAA